MNFFVEGEACQIMAQFGFLSIELNGIHLEVVRNSEVSSLQARSLKY